MKCERSRKANLIVPFGLWLLHKGKIKTAREFDPIAAKLRKIKIVNLPVEIKRLKGTTL